MRKVLACVLAAMTLTGCTAEARNGAQSVGAAQQTGGARPVVGSPPTGTVSGMIVLTGGPLGFGPKSVAGTVLAKRDGVRLASQQVAAGHRFSLALPPGPDQLSVTGTNYRFASETVTVTAGTDQSVTLICSLR